VSTADGPVADGAGAPLTLAFLGDTMLGRYVARRWTEGGATGLIAPEIAALTRAADLTICNLECCISDRGTRWPDPDKPFFFRAPPGAVDVLTHLGVGIATLGNNHAMDYGPDALLDTLHHLADAGVTTVGAGRDTVAARRPVVAEVGGRRVAVVGVTDHPRDYAASAARPGVAYADLRHGVPRWLVDLLGSLDADVVVVTPHWGPNLVPGPVPHVRAAARTFLDAGATLVAGHSAHVFHGAFLGPDPTHAVLFDLGDFIDDYVVDPLLRNDLGLLWLVTVEPDGRVLLDAVPLKLLTAATELASGADRERLVERLTRVCGEFGTVVEDAGDRLHLRARVQERRRAGRR
jgi:poly-gamma-glutamate capsule biosynthesis protein CapA/YwtB (metallophosphatase superfamily)